MILTGATGMVGEGVLLECLGNPAVERVLSVSRRACGHTHPKLQECLVPDFRDLSAIEDQLSGYDGCFYCAGVSSVGMSEAAYSEITFDTAVSFVSTVARMNPDIVVVHVSGAQTDGSEQGKIMWARVKGRAENALAKLNVRATYNFRPGLMTPVKGQKNLKRLYRLLLPLVPIFKLVFPALTLNQVGRAMIRCVEHGASKSVLEVEDIRALA